MARLYDAHLMRARLTTTQFSILRTLERRGGSAPLGALAEELVFERTSLYRALAPLRRAGLITVGAASDRRAKTVALTPRATRRMAAAMPHWIAAQRAVLDRFGAGAWRDLAEDLRSLTAFARDAHAE